LILRALQLLWVDARRAGTSAGPLGALCACGGHAALAGLECRFGEIVRKL